MYEYKYPRPAVTTDVVLFAQIDGKPSVLLIKRANEPYQFRWALPGGFVDVNESLADAARRELREETGIAVVDLDQYKTYGDPGRDPRGHTISVVFIAKLTSDQIKPVAGSDASEAAWHDCENLPPLAFDHAKIIEQAIAWLDARSINLNLET